MKATWAWIGATAALLGGAGCASDDGAEGQTGALGGTASGALGGGTSMGGATGGVAPGSGGSAGSGGAFVGGSTGTPSGGAGSGGHAGSGSSFGGSAAGGFPSAGGVTGGTSSGGSSAGGSPAGGASSGGSPSGGSSSGGSAVGGAAAGGTSSGGSSAGGAASGGSASGGESSAGESSGGAAAGGTSAGGAGSGNIDVPFILGADISNTQQTRSTYVDTDGQTKSIFALLKNHGFNYVRLKTFVDPSAPYGYASNANGCSGLSEPFGDKDHVIAYGQQAKAEGMGFLLDFHYSDVWADPGNQIIPEPWRGASSLTELANYVRDYTEDVIASAVAAGARPDMVQVGNEITPGMLMHVPGPNTDCWGNNPSSAPVGGSASNWDDLATLLKAGIAGVHAVDPTIEIVLHIENHSAADWWVRSAVDHGVEFDILGLSCYVAFQGQPSTWEATFNSLASAYPHLDFIIAEYNPERTAANLIMKNLPDGRGRGTFFWEPTGSGEWGEAMFTWSGGSQLANAQDFAEYDALLPQLGL